MNGAGAPPRRGASFAPEVRFVEKGGHPQPQQQQPSWAPVGRPVAEARRQDQTLPPKKAPPPQGQDWKLPPCYEITKILGEGSYGMVAQALDHNGRRKVAIKRQKLSFESRYAVAVYVLRECAILGQLDHPNIIQLVDLVVPFDLAKFNEIYAVLELADSDMRKLLRTNASLTHEHIHCLMYQFLLGLRYLHGSGVMHRDLKPENIVVYHDCRLKICDFGLAREVGQPGGPLDAWDNTERRLTGQVGTRWYRAPEIILLQPDYTEANDIWSAGCILGELMRMLEGQSFNDRGPLFPGHTCYPMSLDERHGNDPQFYAKGSKDTLAMIVSLMGVPSTEDIQQLQDPKSRIYMSSFRDKGHQGIRATFGHIDPAGTALLEMMLVFNPGKRITARKAVTHSIFSAPDFSDFLDPTVENRRPTRVALDFEKEQHLDQHRLRAFFLREVRRFHPEVPMKR